MCVSIILYIMYYTYLFAQGYMHTCIIHVQYTCTCMHVYYYVPVPVHVYVLHVYMYVYMYMEHLVLLWIVIINFSGKACYAILQ